MKELKKDTQFDNIIKSSGDGVPFLELSSQQTESESSTERTVDPVFPAEENQKESMKEKLPKASELLSKGFAIVDRGVQKIKQDVLLSNVTEFGNVIDIQRVRADRALRRAERSIGNFPRITKNIDKGASRPLRKPGKEVSIPSDLNSAGKVELFNANIASSDSPFVVVNYTVDGKKQEFGLRLDLDKQVFLDKTGDPRVDDDLQSRAVEIVDAVSRSLSPSG